MGRTPPIVLICGLLSIALGVAMLLVSDQVIGLAWLATPIAVLGLCLIGLWLRGRTASGAVEQLPGQWYPYAVVGIGIALWAWVVYWTKFR